MLDDLRTVVHKNIRELSGTSSTGGESFSTPPPTIRAYPQQYKEDESTHQLQTQLHVSSGEEEETDPNKTFMNKVRGTTRKTLQQAEDGFNKLDSVIRQLRTNIYKK